MPIPVNQLELLSQQLNQAHRSAVNAELSARGLSEVGHPVLLTILHSSACQGPEGQCPAQRDLAQALHISPAAVAIGVVALVLLVKTKLTIPKVILVSAVLGLLLG